MPNSWFGELDGEEFIDSEFSLWLLLLLAPSISELFWLWLLVALFSAPSDFECFGRLIIRKRRTSSRSWLTISFDEIGLMVWNALPRLTLEEEEDEHEGEL